MIPRSRNRLRAGVWSLALLSCWPAAALAATSVQIKEVARAMVCLCGDCNRESLATCLCDFAASDRDRIGTALDAGLQQQPIVQQFVDEYGPVVLATPPAEGSNLLAWVAPITLLLLGIAVVRSVLLSWRRRYNERPEAASAPDCEPGSSYEEKLHSELDRYDTF